MQALQQIVLAEEKHLSNPPVLTQVTAQDTGWGPAAAVAAHDAVGTGRGDHV